MVPTQRAWLAACVIAGIGFAQTDALGPAPKGPMKYTRPADLENVSYGPHERNVFDLWQAKSDRPTPLIVYLHPGGFNHGDKTWIEWLDKPLLELCLKRGISVATGNYRYVNNEVHLPTPMYDGARLIQFLRLHARDYHVDSRWVVPVGGSAGAGMSLWLAFHPDLAKAGSGDPVERQSTRVAVAGSIDGQCSYDPRLVARLVDPKLATYPTIPALFGVHGDSTNAISAFPLYEEASPIHFLSADDPPVFLYFTHNVRPLPPADNNELIHNPRQGLYLKEQMEKLGIECVMRTPKDYPAGSGVRPFTTEMLDFIVKHLPK